MGKEWMLFTLGVLNLGTTSLLLWCLSKLEVIMRRLEATMIAQNCGPDEEELV